MGWKVSATVHGGAAYAPATLEEYSAIAQTLDDESSRMRHLASSWEQAPFDLNIRRRGVVCPSLERGDPTLAAPGHAALPYDRLDARCRQYAGSCLAIAERLSEMADLLIRAHSLYSQAEQTTRMIINALVGTATSMVPRTTGLAVGGLALAGMVSGATSEGRLNPMHGLASTAWTHEGVVAGIAALTGRMLMVDGPFGHATLDRAAGLISPATASLYDAVQGNVLTVTEVASNTEVVRQSRSVSDAMENLRRLAEERLGTIDLGSGLSYGTIAIQRYRKPDGGSSWLVTIPGTDGMPDSPFGWPQNVELMGDSPEGRMRADSARMVAGAMRRAGIGADEPVALVGHSQGGIVAATIAADLQDRYAIAHVVTAGSPIANHPIPSTTWVTSVEIDDEVVAALDGAPNPSAEHWLTVRGTPHRTQDGESDPAPHGRAYDGADVADPPSSKEISHWLKYHQAAYHNAATLGSPALQRHERHFQEVIDGELVSTTYWQGRMGKPSGHAGGR